MTHLAAPRARRTRVHNLASSTPRSGQRGDAYEGTDQDVLDPEDKNTHIVLFESSMAARKRSSRRGNFATTTDSFVLRIRACHRTIRSLSGTLSSYKAASCERSSSRTKLISSLLNTIYRSSSESIRYEDNGTANHSTFLAHGNRAHQRDEVVVNLGEPLLDRILALEDST